MALITPAKKQESVVEVVAAMKALVPEFISNNSEFEKLGPTPLRNGGQYEIIHENLPFYFFLFQFSPFQMPSFLGLTKTS